MLKLGPLILACLAASAAAFAPAPIAKVRPEFTNSIEMKLVQIPAGEFLMGSSPEEAKAVYEVLKEYFKLRAMPLWLEAESRRRRVKLNRAFYMGAYEVTQAEYEKVMGKNPSWFSSTGKGRAEVAGLDTSRFPVECVGYEEAVEFCKKLTALDAEKKQNRAYRLPTEAEWEYACRAGTRTATHFGDSLSSEQANISGDLPLGSAKMKDWHVRTCRVGSYNPNAFGLYDMHGNVSEWCSDLYDKDKTPRPDANIGEKPSPNDHVLRGGNWNTSGFGCRSAMRAWAVLGKRHSGNGFRVVCDTP